jgi:DNA-binding MarR family transcriptional regulator
VLLHVVRGERVRLSEIAGAEGLNPTMLSRVIAGLAEAGLVSRASDEDDKRAAWVTPTAAGKRLAERMRRERTDALIVALEALDEADRRAIERALPALERVSERLKGRRP